MYLGQFFPTDLMTDLAVSAQEAYDEEQEAYQEAVETGPQPMTDEQVVTEPAPAPAAPAQAGMSPVTMMLIGGALLWLVFKKK